MLAPREHHVSTTSAPRQSHLSATSARVSTTKSRKVVRTPFRLCGCSHVLDVGDVPRARELAAGAGAGQGRNITLACHTALKHRASHDRGGGAGRNSAGTLPPEQEQEKASSSVAWSRGLLSLPRQAHSARHAGC